jgi:septum formation protein
MRLSRIVLGSASPRRLELVRSLGLVVEVAVSGHDETDPSGVTPAELASYHAAEKLRAVVRVHGARPDVPVLAADTVVDLDGTALGKPRDAAEARRMLAMLSGREHRVHTAFALAVPHVTSWTQECATTLVRFYPLEADEISSYVATGEPLDKAGAYGIQGRAAALVERIDGDFYTVMGLPLARLVRALRRLGFALPETNSTRLNRVP